MPGRKYTVANRYRYGFNGKENDPEVVGTGEGTQDYGMRIYNPALGRFLSVDPLTKKYPELTPYQFASNRPIDGIDQDGLEYATFTILIHKDKVAAIKVTTDYELKRKGTKGAGIQYNYKVIDDNGNTISDGESKFVKNNVYGIYAGSENPQLPDIGGNKDDVSDYYGLAPIDELDAAAKQHDLDYDETEPTLKGMEGILNPESRSPNNKLMITATKVLLKKALGSDDNISKKPVTDQQAAAAKIMLGGFGIANGVAHPVKKSLDKAVDKGASKIGEGLKKVLRDTKK